MAKLLATGKAAPGQPLAADVQPFKYGHKGSLAYVGGDKAVMDVPGMSPITGFAAGEPVHCNPCLLPHAPAWAAGMASAV